MRPRREVGSEGPSGSAASLLGGNRMDILGHELIDVPRRRPGARSTVLMGEPATFHGGRPAASSEHLGEALEQRVIADTDDVALERHVLTTYRDSERATRVPLDVQDLARSRTDSEVVPTVDAERTHGSHVEPAVGVNG